MQRALLAIGCDSYEYVSPELNGAELDARRIFEALTNPSIGDHDLERSRLLLSPTLAEDAQGHSATGYRYRQCA